MTEGKNTNNQRLKRHQQNVCKKQRNNNGRENGSKSKFDALAMRATTTKNKTKRQSSNLLSSNPFEVIKNFFLRSITKKREREGHREKKIAKE